MFQMASVFKRELYNSQVERFQPLLQGSFDLEVLPPAGTSRNIQFTGGYTSRLQPTRVEVVVPLPQRNHGFH